MQDQKAAVNTGQWLLYRYNPERVRLGENPLQLDAAAPRVKIGDYFKLEQRFKMLEKSEPSTARQLLAQAQEDVNARRALYEFLATRKSNTTANP